VGKVNARLAVIIVVRHEQAVRDHLPQDALELGGIIPDRTQLRTRLLSPSIRAPLAEADLPRQDPARDSFLFRGAARVRWHRRGAKAPRRDHSARDRAAPPPIESRIEAIAIAAAS